MKVKKEESTFNRVNNDLRNLAKNLDLLEKQTWAKLCLAECPDVCAQMNLEEIHNHAKTLLEKGLRELNAAYDVFEELDRETNKVEKATSQPPKSKPVTSHGGKL